MSVYIYEHKGLWRIGPVLDSDKCWIFSEFSGTMKDLENSILNAFASSYTFILALIWTI